MGGTFDGNSPYGGSYSIFAKIRIEKMTKNRKNMVHAPFRIEIKIKDAKGRKIYHWKEGNNNLILGMKKTDEFVEEKLGIAVREVIKSQEVDTKNKKVKKMVQGAFGNQLDGEGI